MDERRNFQRVPFATEAEINFSGKKFHGELIDISLKGALVQGKGIIPLAVGSRGDLTIHLLDSDISMQFEVDLVHCLENRLGFMFIGEDTETATHLRRLMELNIGSSEIIDREILSWLKDK